MKIDKIYQISFFSFNLLHLVKIRKIMRLAFALTDQPM